MTLLVVGCSNGGESPDHAAPTVGPSPGASSSGAVPGDSGTAAQVRAAWEDFWDAMVRSENRMDASPEQFDGVARGPVAENQLKRVRDQSAMGLRRTGAPEFRDVQVTTEGVTGRVTACVNQDTWGAEKDGKPLPATDFGFRPTASDLEQVGDDWVVVTLTSPGDVTC